MVSEGALASTTAWKPTAADFAFADGAITATRIINPSIVAATGAARGTARRGTEGVTSLSPFWTRRTRAGGEPYRWGPAPNALEDSFGKRLPAPGRSIHSPLTHARDT